MKNHRLQLTVLTLAYCATGKLGMFLAVPPGYATAIYPPSGIALAGLLILGYRAWFGVLLGSFLMNLSIAASHAPIVDYIAVVVALIIAIGATLQAIAGAYLVKRFADFPNPLASVKSVLNFMFFGGVLSTLVNASISVSTLIAMGQVPTANFLTNWTTWWMGDAIGIFIFTPLMLVWFYQQQDYFRDRKMLITLTILSAFFLTVMLVVYESRQETAHLKFEFDKDALALNAALNKSITAHLTVLRSLQSFYAASVSVDRDEFHEFVAQSLSDFQGIQAIEWCPIVTHLQRDDFEKSVQKEGLLNFKIKEIDTNQNLIRASHREFYMPVTFSEPSKGNESALGFDLNSSAIRSEALGKARDSGKITTTSKITLVQDNQVGVLAFAPIYKNHLPHQSLQERQQNIVGYVLAVFHINDIFNVTLTHINSEKLHLQLFDENAPTQQRLLFSDPSAAFVLHEKGLFGKNISLVSSSLILMGNRQWRFEIAPTQDYFAYHHSDNSWLILLTGLVLTSMAGVFAMVSSGREMILQQLIDERTNHLIEIESELKRCSQKRT